MPSHRPDAPPLTTTMVLNASNAWPKRRYRGQATSLYSSCAHGCQTTGCCLALAETRHQLTANHVHVPFLNTGSSTKHAVKCPQFSSPIPSMLTPCHLCHRAFRASITATAGRCAVVACKYKHISGCTLSSLPKSPHPPKEIKAADNAIEASKQLF